MPDPTRQTLLVALSGGVTGTPNAAACPEWLRDHPPAAGRHPLVVGPPP